ncbi:MAG: NDMA-dependent alcohol dehydrogenase [Streptosporangiales bacterium]|nr:NDMA-dependent alcohol dehydrogenase [Streptosporangiales bacterium]
MKTMAAVMREPGEKWWEIEELELDEPKAGEVRIKFMASGLCHSDDHVRTGDLPARLPIVGGHEGAGIVESVGPEVTRVKPGDRVVCSFIPACGSCPSCSTGRQYLCDEGRNALFGGLLDDTFRFHSKAGEDVGGMCVLGTFSQYAVVNQSSCVKLVEDIPFEVAALVGCGVPTGWGSAVYGGEVGAGDTVVVYGVGGVGIHAVQGARLAGATTVVAVDPLDSKLDFAKRLGATHTFTDAASAQDFVREHSWGRMADVAICTIDILSEEVVGQAVDIVGKAGKVVVTSVGKAEGKQIVVRGRTLTHYGLQVRGVLCGNTNPLFDIPRLVRLYRSGDLKLDEVITRRYRLDEVNQGYHDLLDGKNIRGVIVHEH